MELVGDDMKRQVLVIAIAVALLALGVGLGESAQRAGAAAAPQVSVTSATAGAGAQVTVTIEGDSGDATFGAFTIDLAYDPSVARAVDCSSEGGLCKADSTPSKARVAGIYFPGVSGHTEFGSVTFEVLGHAGSSTPLTLQIVELADGQAVDIKPQTEVHSGSITVSGQSQLMGDANCDGTINAVDGLAVLREVSGQAEVACRAGADVDCDGALHAVDALFILRFIAGLSVGANPGCTPIGETL